MSNPFDQFDSTESGAANPFDQFDAAKPTKKQGIMAELGSSLKRGIGSTIDYGKVSLTDNPDEIAGIVSDNLRNQAPQSAARQKMNTDIQPYAQEAADAQGIMANIGAYGKLAGKRALQLAENPREFAGMVAENLPNSAPGIAGMIAGGVAGAATPIPFGAAIGGVVGGTAGGYKIEQGSSMFDQITKEAQARGIDTNDKAALSVMISEKYPEFLKASQLKGIGTAGTDAALNVATLGVAGMGERTLVKEARTVADLAKAGTITGEEAASTLAGIEAKNAGRNTIGQKVLRGTGVTAGEMAGESASEAVGQQLAYGKLDPLDVIDEGLLAFGQGVGMAAGRKFISPLVGATDKDTITQEIERARSFAADLNASVGGDPNAVPTLVTDFGPIQRRIDELHGVDATQMDDKARAQYEKDFEAAYGEVVGYTTDANGLEIPFTAGDYLNSQVRSADMTRDKPLAAGANDQSANRLNQLADEEAMQQPDVALAARGIAAAPVIPVVGPLSAVANAAVQSGAHQATVMQQAAAQVTQNTTPEGKAGTPAGAQKVSTAPAQGPLTEVAGQAPNVATSAPNVATPASAFDVSGKNILQLKHLAAKGQPGWKEAATAELVRLNGSISESVPALNAGNSVNLPATSISSLQDQLDKTEPFSEQSQLLTERLQLAVTDDAKSAIGTGEMPVYKVTDHVSVAIHPSAQKEGMIQVTRYTKDGVIGDSQYNSIDEAVRFEGLAHKPRIPSNEAIAHIENSIAAEAEYQKRKNEQQAGAGLPASTAGDSRPAPVANAPIASPAKFDLQGLVPGTPEYNAAFDAWANERASNKTDDSNKRQREENKQAIGIKNRWRSKVREWFDGASDGDSITDVTGQRHVVIVKSRKDGTITKSLLSVDENGTPLPEGRAATGIGKVGNRLEGLHDGGLDEDTGSAFAETSAQSFASSLGQQIETGEAKTEKATPANQVPIKNAAPSSATVPAETVAPNQEPIKKDEQPKNASDRLRSGEINVEQFMEATGLTDDDVGTFSSNGARNKADAQAKKESRYHAGIEKISAAIFEAERGLTQGSTAQSRRAYQANVAKYRQAQETLGVIAKHYEHPFKNTLLSKLPPFLESRFGKQWDGIEYGDLAKRAFHGDSYRKWVDLLIGAADNKNGTPISPAVSQPKADTAPEAAQDKAPVSTPQPDPALQNRDRGRAASVNQMQSIARNPDYMRLGPSRTPDSGAPMVFAVGGDTNKIAPSSFGANDIAVMSDGQRVPFRYAVVDASSVEPSNFADGATNPAFASDATGTIKALNNGRTAGVRAAYDGNTAANYTSELLADQAHGVSPEAIRSTPNPMLVRVYAEQANTGDMAAKSQGQGLGMSASERATQDAELMTADVLDKFAPGDIASAGNRDFVRAFVGKLAENELADMMDATGNLSQDGRRRIEAALLTASYGKSDLVQELFESTDTDIKAIGNALKVMSGQWAAMRQAAKEGGIDPATDMTANLIEAVNIVRRSRAEGSSIAELAGQGDLMGGNYLNELSELFLRIFYKGKNYDRARGGDKVIAALQEVVTSAMNTKAEAGLFGDSFKATPKQIVESARSKIDEENKPASQSSLFGANGQATAVSQGNRGEGAAQSGEVGSRPVGTGSSQETGKQAEPVAKAADQAPTVDAPFDSDAWNKAREERIKASKQSGAKHLDSITPSVEAMRGREVFYVHNPKQRGVIRTVDNRGNVYVYWSDKYSADRESASESVEDNKSWLKSTKALPYLRTERDGKVFVMQSSLGMSDMKDYVFADSVSNTATVDAKKQEEAKPVALLSIAGREKFDPISLETAAGVVARMRQTIKEVWKVDLRLVPTFSALPQEVKDAIAKYGEDTRAKGVLHKGSVYIVADEHASDADVETTILHEIKGHVGLRRLYSDAINKGLGALYMSIGGRRGLADLAKARGFTDELQGYAESLSNSDFTDEERTRIVMEELLSHIAQDPKFGDKVKAIVGKIRAWLRDNGFMALAKFGEADLLNILAKASKALETVRDDNGPVVLMTAWHGSPHDHNKFDSSKIGTGEGAQAYGFGLYFAGARSVAEYYRDALRGKSGYDLSAKAQEFGFEINAGQRGEVVRQVQAGKDDGSSAKRIAKRIQNAKSSMRDIDSAALERLVSDFMDNGYGKLYQVELAPSENEYLDWDKPLSEQSELVRDALIAAYTNASTPKNMARRFVDDEKGRTGEDFYREMQNRRFADEFGEGSAKSASDYLHSIGIRGIRYLDGSSRSKPLKEIKAEFLAELPEDADFDEVMDLVGTGQFSPKNEALIKALAADEWLGFDYPAQAISTALGNGLSNYDASPELMKAVSSAKDGGTHNFVIFNDADVSITAKYNIASKDKLTPADKAIYGMAAEGKSAAEVLKFIASASRNPFNRQVARLLMKTGIAPSITVGDGKGWKMNAGEDNKYAAGYNPKSDTISLFRPASAERNMLHELIHAATLKALSKKGMASGQMIALYKHVKKSGKLKGMYGMSDVDEFIAEAFSNPKFQAMLKQVSAAPVGGKPSSAWDWFVRVVRGILGLKQGQDNALSQALDIGIGVMRENMRLNEGTGDVRYNAAPGKINQTDTEAFKRWFGDSKVVDAGGKPLVVYHGTQEDITNMEGFDPDRAKSEGGGFYFSDSPLFKNRATNANTYAGKRGTVIPVYLKSENLYETGYTEPKPAANAPASEWDAWLKGAEDFNRSIDYTKENYVSDAIAEAKRAGADGVVLKGFEDDRFDSGNVIPSDVYIVFDPTQIKSAIGNYGDFDGSNPDIRYNVADEGWSVSEQAKETVMRLAGRPMLDPSDPFAAENARLREQDQSLWSKAKKQLRRYLAPGGLLPQSVFAEKIKRDSEFQAVEFDVRHLIGGLEHAVKADFGMAFDKLSKEQMRPITEALAGNVPASLPEATKTAAVAMRQYIDGMSTEYLKIIQQKIDAKMLKAIESGKDSDKAQAINEIELFEKIKGNIGRYVHRSYQAFDDPKWFEKVPAHVLNASRLYLKQGYMEAGETDAKAAQMAEVTLHEILKNGTAYDSMESFIAESKLGAKDLSVLMRRKEVPPQIRALLGEYPDARLNFTKSATKMGRLIWNTRFLDRVRDMGMGSFFFEGKDRPPNATTQIAADGSEVYAPLNGLWTFPETAQAFKDALGKEQMSDLYRAIVRANGLVKYGKAQPLDAEIKTPTGPIVMGDVEVGTVVCGIDGPTTVTGVFPQGDMDVYRLTFCDGSSTEASDEHLWNVTIDGKERTLTTADLLSLPSYRIAKRQVSVPLGRAHFDTKDVPLDPYLMGVLLGDGSFRGSVLRLSTPEKDIVDRVRALLPEGYAMNSPASWSDIDYAITAPNKSEGRRHKIRVALEEMGLWGHLSLDKFIPVQYMRNSHEIRMEVARGLLDTDGWVDRLGQPHFTTSSRRLAEDFQELAESLGASVIWGEKESASGNIAYDLGVRVEDARKWFWLPRKAEKATPRKKPAKRTISTIEYVGMKQCQCIMVDDPRHLYLTDRFIVTHNTVLAPTTAMRNWQSAMFFSLANGHFDLTQMKKSISAFREQVSQKATGQDLKYLRHLKQLGVVYDTPYAGEMARLMEDARMEELLSSDKGDAVRWFRKANQLARGFYTFGDDFWKIIGFENEKAGLMKAGLSLQEAEIEAAKRIRDTYPTYSMVGRGVQWLSRFPLAGTFVSFPAEIIRTSGNMLRTVAADLKSDNPKLRELGMKRAAGMVFVSAAFYSLAALSMAMAGVGDDEDEAIRDLAPEWQKNSTFLYLGRDEKGNLRYFDMSFLDPYGYWKRPITAMLRNQPWEDSLASGLRGMLEPFLGADISAKAIFEAVSNAKESGGKVYKENDGAIDQAVDIADHLRKALQPGVVGNVERLVKAAGDVRKSSGQPYSMEDELVALAGWRATTIDPKTALYYRSFEFTDSLSEARKTLTDTLRDANSVSPEDIKDAKARAASKQEQAFKEMSRLVSAAESAGMSKMQIVQTLRLSNISQANIGSLMRGATPDVSITPQLAARAVRQASQMRGPEFAADVFDRYRQAMAK